MNLRILVVSDTLSVNPRTMMIIQPTKLQQAIQPLHDLYETCYPNLGTFPFAMGSMVKSSSFTKVSKTSFVRMYFRKSLILVRILKRVTVLELY
jgi:hypothetical protein